MSHSPAPISATALSEARRNARHRARVDRIYIMLASASLAAFGIVATASALLTNLL